MSSGFGAMIYLYKKARTRQRRLKEEAEQKQQTTEPLDIPGQQKEQTAALEVPELKAEQIETGNEPTVTSTKSEPKIEPKTKKTKPVETEEEKIEKKRRRAYRWKLMISLLPPAFLAAVDTTIVATATTTIASDFSKWFLCTSGAKYLTFSLQMNSINSIGSSQRIRSPPRLSFLHMAR